MSALRVDEYYTENYNDNLYGVRFADAPTVQQRALVQAKQRCNLSGSICKANDPRASSCSVRTFTNGSCSCNCKDRVTGKSRAPAPRVGTVASESRPVSSTTLKPGVIPRAGAPGSPEAEGTGTTGVTAVGGTSTSATAPAPNTKFGSFDIAALQKAPPIDRAAAIKHAALAKQYEPLKLLQTQFGQDLHYKGLALDRAVQRVKDAKTVQLKRAFEQQLYEKSKELLETYDKWVGVNVGVATSKGGTGLPVEKMAVAGFVGAAGLKGIAGLPGGIPTTADIIRQKYKGGSARGWGALFQVAGSVGSDIAIGCSTGDCPSAADIGKAAYANAVGVGLAAAEHEAGVPIGKTGIVGGAIDIPKSASAASKFANKIIGGFAGGGPDLAITAVFNAVTAINKAFPSPYQFQEGEF